MAAGSADDPAIYGPVNGQFVTLAEFQQWQVQALAQQTAAASAAFDAEVQDTGIPATNPYVIVSTPTTPVVPGGSTGSSSTLKANELAFGGGDIGTYCLFYPDDPLCDIWGGGGIVVTGGSTTVEQPIIIEQGISATDVNATVDAGLSSVWSGFVGTLDGVLAALIAGIQSALTAIGNALKAAYAILARLGGFILQALESLTRQVVAGVLRVLTDIRDLFKALYDDVIAPIANALSGLRGRLISLYTRFIRPMLIWIQDVRKVLGILALFHVPLAQKLDAKLADLERRVTQPLLYLLSFTNGIANFVNLIITGTYLLQQPLWLFSFQAYMGQSLNLQLNAMTTPIGAADLAAANAQNAQPTQQQSEAAGLAFVQGGSGPYAAIAAQSTATLTATLAQGQF